MNLHNNYRLYVTKKTLKKGVANDNYYFEPLDQNIKRLDWYKQATEVYEVTGHKLEGGKMIDILKKVK